MKVSLDEIVNNPALANPLTSDGRRRVIPQCAAVLSAIASAPTELGKDHLLSTEETAERLGMSRRKHISMRAGIHSQGATVVGGRIMA